MAAGSYERKSFTGGAQPTSLDAAIGGSPSSFTVASGAGASYPTGNDGPFVVVIGRNTATEEKILVASRVNDQFNIDTRGYDDTAAVDHDAGEVVEHVLDASTVDQANRYVNLQSAKGDIVAHDGTNSVIQSVGANDYLLTADSTSASGLAWTQVNTASIAADAVTNAQIADDSIDSEHYVDGSIDTAHLADDAVTAAKIAAGAVGNTELGSDAVSGDKIADDAVDTEHIADASLGRKEMFPVATVTWSSGTTGSPTYEANVTLTEGTDVEGLISVATLNYYNTIVFSAPGLYYCVADGLSPTASGTALWKLQGTVGFIGFNSVPVTNNTTFGFSVNATSNSGIYLYVYGADNNYDGISDTATTWSAGTITIYKMMG